MKLFHYCAMIRQDGGVSYADGTFYEHEDISQEWYEQLRGKVAGAIGVKPETLVITSLTLLGEVK